MLDLIFNRFALIGTVRIRNANQSEYDHFSALGQKAGLSNAAAKVAAPSLGC